MDYALIELKHIQLELQYGRTHHFRHFVDQYFCYKHGYVTKSGKASWSKIPWNEYVSEEANKTRDKKLIVEKEHILPLGVITSYLVELGANPSIESIKVVIDKYLHFATIINEEDKLLNAHGLNSKMPDEYYDKSSDLYGDMFARYKVAGIKLRHPKRLN
jgi:hypothetical protein